MTSVIQTINDKVKVLSDEEDLVILGSENPKVIILDIINYEFNLLEYRNLVDDNEIVLDSCKAGNVDLSITKIYYVRKDYDFNKLAELIKADNPYLIIILGKIVLQDMCGLKEIITNTVINVPIFGRIPVIPSYSPRYIYDKPYYKYILNRCMMMVPKCIEEITNNKNYIKGLHEYQEISERIAPVLNQINAINNFMKTNTQLIDYDAMSARLNTLSDSIANDQYKLNYLIESATITPAQLTKISSPEIEIPAESTIIYSYEQFKEFCKENVEPVKSIGFDVETNALPVMDINHEIVGFSLGNENFKGCYVPFKSIGFKMPEDDTNKIIEYLKNEIFIKSIEHPDEREIWVYNCQHEIPVVYNHYNIFLENIKDLYVWVKLLNCGKSWETGSRTLKSQVKEKCQYKDWSLDLDAYFVLFRLLNKPEKQIEMKTLLSKYYTDPDELNDILNQTIETYNDIKDTLSSTKVISYEYVPCKLIGKYGSLDSSSLFELKDKYQDDIERWNKAFNIDLNKGFDLWQKVHIAHVIMEMNGLYFNDKKAEKLNVWVDEQSKDLMNQIVTSPLARPWVKNGFYYEFSRNVLMMNYVDEILVNDGLAKVVQGRNGITKECIKVHEISLLFIRAMNEINKIIDNFNMLISRNDFCFQDDNEFIENGITKEFIEIYRFMNEVSRGKSFTKMEIEYQKGEFIVKINWQNFLIFYKLSSFYNQKPNLLDEEFDKWFEEKLKNAKEFADYKDLFNVNSTTKSFREYISDILLSDQIKIAHTYYKLYEFTESAQFEDDKESLKSKNPKYSSPHYDFVEDYEDMMANTVGEEVFSPKRLEVFTELFNKYVDDKFINDLKYKRKLAPCFDWYLKDNFNVKNIRTNYYKLSTLDSGMIEHLTQLYMMLNCNIDDNTTWTDEFRFMFNYKFIKKLIKAKSTYIDGTTGRGNAYYVDNKFYLKEKFPRRLQPYNVGNEINNVYDQDKAIELELENGIKIALPLNEELTLADGTKKLAKDVLPDDDVDVTKYINEFQLDSDDISVDDLDTDED